MTKTQPAIAYVRVSSRAQDYATQRSAIERAACARGDVIEDWRAEKRSAKTMQREELQRLLAEARAGALHGRRLYLYRLDRLTRTGIADTLTTLADLRAGGVEIVSVGDGFDLNGPHAEVIIAVMAWAAKMERLAVNERIASARERLAEEGRSWGRPRRMSKDLVARARAMHAEGRTVREIAMALKQPKSTIGRALASQNDAVSEPPAES